MVNGDIGIAFFDTVLFKSGIDFNEIGICKNHLVLIVSSQHCMVKLEVSYHADDTKILDFSLCKSSLKIFFKDIKVLFDKVYSCLLYTSDAADEEDSVDLGGRRIIKKKKTKKK